MNKKVFFSAIHPVSLFSLAFIPYLLLYFISETIIGRFEIISLLFLLSYLTLFLLIIFIYKLINQLIHKENITYKADIFLNFSDVLFVEILFLLFSSLIINPLSFVFLIGPVHKNIFLHLIIIYFIIKYTKRRSESTIPNNI